MKMHINLRKGCEMNEYKFLREFGEIVPGMIFENDGNDVIHILEVDGSDIVYSSPNTSRSKVSLHDFTRVLKLTHDPRPAKKSIQEKINDHKKQIEILEKELQKESLKNVFSKDQYYKIKTKDNTFICKFGMHDFDNNSIWIERVDRYTKKISTDDIQKVWHVENLKDVFGFCETVFERKD